MTVKDAGCRAAERMMIRKEQQQLRVRPQLIAIALLQVTVQKMHVTFRSVVMYTVHNVPSKVKFPLMEHVQQRIVLSISVKRMPILN